MADCIFCKIIRGEIPAEKVYETQTMLAFLDIHPINLGHTLLVPKSHYTNLYDLPEETLKDLAVNLKELALMVKKGTGAEGINIGMNNERAAGQLVNHAHLHVIPRFAGDGHEHWRGKEYSKEELASVAQKIRKA